VKIAFITFEYPPFIQGGAGTYAENITGELVKLKNEVHVITPLSGQCVNYEVKDGVFIHRIGFINKPLLGATTYWLNVRRGFKKLQQEIGNFDIIHGNAVSDFGLNKGLTGRAPRVITVHHLARDVVDTLRPSAFARIKHLGGEIGFVPLVEGQCLGRADRLIAGSEYTRAKIASLYGIPLDKVTVVYYGWEEKNFAFSDREKTEVKTKYGISGDKPILLFVGRVDDRRKGLDLLLRAFKIVLSKMDASLVICGSGNQKPLRALLSSSDMNRVIFTGFVDDVILPKLYSLCAVYVCPSRLEGFGLTLLDAMAAGKPVVATNVGGIPEIIIPGENGLLVQPDNVSELATAIIQLLGNASQVQAIGENNRKKVATHYSWQAAAQRTAEIYAELVST
jgi:glycosyltransferase involved in cell wall biosynthesis